MFAKGIGSMEKHAYAIDAFIVDFSSIMFAKTNGSTVRMNTLLLSDTFIADFSRLWLL